MDLSLAKLRHLVTVSRCGSLSRAAAELNISQPALSRSIQTIEQRYGFPIFNRVGHGVVATAAGAQVIALAEPVLHSLTMFDSNLRLMGAGQAGDLSLGLTPLLASEILARFAGHFFESGAPVRLRALVRPADVLLDALKSNAVEMIFFPDSALALHDEVEVEPMGSFQPVCVVRAGHPLAGATGLSRRDLAEFPWASSVEAPNAARSPGDAAMYCDNYHVLRDAVMRSNLVCICSQTFIAGELSSGQLVPIEVADLALPPTTVHMARMKGGMMSPLAIEAKARIAGYLQQAAALPVPAPRKAAAAGSPGEARRRRG